MIYTREESEPVRTGINIYPGSSNQLGFVIKLGQWVRFVRYNRLQRRFRYHGPGQGDDK